MRMTEPLTLLPCLPLIALLVIRHQVRAYRRRVLQRLWEAIYFQGVKR